MYMYILLYIIDTERLLATVFKGQIFDSVLRCAVFCLELLLTKTHNFLCFFALVKYYFVVLQCHAWKKFDISTNCLSPFRPPEVERSSHPVICKKRSPDTPVLPSKTTSKPAYPFETTRTPGWTFRQSSDRPMWNVSSLSFPKCFKLT